MRTHSVVENAGHLIGRAARYALIVATPLVVAIATIAAGIGAVDILYWDPQAAMVLGLISVWIPTAMATAYRASRHPRRHRRGSLSGPHGSRGPASHRAGHLHPAAGRESSYFTVEATPNVVRRVAVAAPGSGYPGRPPGGAVGS